MKKNTCFLLTALLLFALLTPAVFADTGPKPSVTVSFEGVENRECWATLLSKEAHWGPYAAIEDGGERSAWSSGDDDVWDKMTAYKDADGFYFLQVLYDVSDNGSFCWSYYPPDIFKVLLYFPDTDAFAVSEIYKTYAFDSYYTFTYAKDALTTDLAPFDESASGEEAFVTDDSSSRENESSTQSEVQLTGRKSYDVKGELIGFFGRLIITLALELLLALAFGYRNKKALGVICVVNLVTQITLNLALNVIRFKEGPRSFVFWYIVLELAVVLIEAGVYVRMLPAFSDKKARRGVLYAAVSNLVSFGAGMALAQFLPDIF